MARLVVGDDAPDFEAMLQDGSTIRLETILSAADCAGLILYFYPKDSTPGCTVQACDFRDRWSRLQAAGWRVIGVSKDGEASHQRFIDRQRLPFDLIVDAAGNLMQMYGAWGEKRNYGRTYEGVIRSSFAIMASGRLAWVGYGVRTKGHVDRLLAALGID